MKILVVATKAPWPPIDGGRLVLLNTIEALAGAGHRVTLVAPIDERSCDADAVAARLGTSCAPHLVRCRPRGVVRSLLESALRGVPVTIARHSIASVGRAVHRLLQSEPFDVVHAEQLHALRQAWAPGGAGPAVVLRAHNVESELWRFSTAHRRGIVRTAFSLEARRLESWERSAVRRLPAIVALTRRDARDLRRLCGRENTVHRVPAPFAADLPARPGALEGQPAVTLLASCTWLPNRDAVWHFAGETWARVRQLCPSAVLHVFGTEPSPHQASGLRWHPSPEDSAEAFPRGSIAVIPSRHPTGVPMKGLEAWARGVAVVACPEAAQALEAEDGRELLVADGPESIARAISRLADERELEERLIAGGRRALRERHDPTAVAARLAEVYARSR